MTKFLKEAVLKWSDDKDSIFHYHPKFVSWPVSNIRHSKLQWKSRLQCHFTKIFCCYRKTFIISESVHFATPQELIYIGSLLNLVELRLSSVGLKLSG
jgi:hypothetical protein